MVCLRCSRTIKIRNVVLFSGVMMLFAIIGALTGMSDQVQAVAMHDGGGIKCHLIIDENQKITLEHTDGSGPDKTFGGKINLTISGTVDTAGTNWAGILTGSTDEGFNFIGLIPLPENLPADQVKLAFDEGFKQNPNSYYALVGDNRSKIPFTNTDCILTYQDWKDSSDPNYPDTPELRNTLGFKLRSNVLKGVWSTIWSLVWHGQGAKSIPFELHFSLDVNTLMGKGDSSDYSPLKALTKYRLPVSNSNSGEEKDQFNLPIEVFSSDQTYNHNAWLKSPDLWIKSDQLTKPDYPADKLNIQPLPTWSSYLSPWDHGNEENPSISYNTQDATSYPEVPDVKTMLPGPFLQPNFVMNQRQDNPALWTNDYVKNRFARVINFHTHQVADRQGVSVTSSKSGSITTYQFAGKDSNGNPLVAPPVGTTGEPSAAVPMQVTVADFVTPSIEQLSFVGDQTVFHAGQKLPVHFLIKAPTSRKVTIEEKVDSTGTYQTIGEQDLRNLTEDQGMLSFNYDTVALTNPGTHSITFRITDIDDNQQRHSNEKSLTATIDRAALSVKSQDTTYQYDAWSPEKEIVTLLDANGNQGNIKDVKVTIYQINGSEKTIVDQVDTQTAGQYEIDYEYLGLTGKTALTVAPSQASLVVHDGDFPVGTAFDPKKLFDHATGNDQQPIPYQKVKVTYTPTPVDDQKAGKYTITYDISDIVHHQEKRSVTWSYFYNNQLDFYDLKKAQMNFDPIKLNGKDRKQSLDACQMTIYDTTDPQTQNPWRLEVAYDKNDAATKSWEQNNLSLTLNPTSASYVKSENDITINDQLQLIAGVKQDAIDQKKILTTVQLAPTLTTLKSTMAKDYQAKLLWNLVAAP